MAEAEENESLIISLEVYIMITVTKGFTPESFIKELETEQVIHISKEGAPQCAFFFALLHQLFSNERR
jgi:hypothetical protein